MSKPVNSTPSKHKLASRSQAGNLHYLYEDIKADLEYDVEHATELDFDDISKYFLAQCLVDDEAKILDKLMSRLEEVLENPETATEDENEATLRRQVDVFLEELYTEAMEAVLDTANDKDIRACLKAFVKTLEQSDEKLRYEPYAELCNKSLDHMSERNILPLRLRKPDELELRYMRSDPKEIESTYKGMDKALKRKPDLIHTSRKAMAALLLQQAKDRLIWPGVLGSNEFKARGSNLSQQARKTVDSAYIFKRSLPAVKIEHNELEKYDPEPGLGEAPESPSPVPTATRSSKRRRQEEEDEAEGPASKIQRGSTSNAKGKDKQASSSKRGTSKASKGKITNTNPTGSSSRQEGPAQTVPPKKLERSSQKAISGRAQCASYALEALSSNVGVHHVINTLIIDEYLWIWYYDRQGILRSDGISLVADFPRLLVLLLAFQRFTVQDWGIVPSMNPDALMQLHVVDPKVEGRGTTSKTETARKNAYPTGAIELKFGDLSNAYCDSERMFTKVDINTAECLSHQPHCIAGRATAVYNATGVRANGDVVPMVVKVSNPELERSHEGEMMLLVRELAEEEGKCSDNVPTLYFYDDVPGTSTKRIRVMLRRPWRGHRVMRIVGQKRLEKLTVLKGDEFVRAWLQAVFTHSYLWKKGFEHGDPSLSNVMYDPEKKCAVLTDYDLSVLRNRPTDVHGSDRTGTIPFMALELLSTEYWSGTLKREHYHELEAFIWTLPYTFFLFQDGKQHRNKLVDAWSTSDYEQCRKEKLAFYNTNDDVLEKHVQQDFEFQWPLAWDLLAGLVLVHAARKDLRSKNRARPRVVVPVVALSEDELALANATSMWAFFTECVKKHFRDNETQEVVDELTKLVPYTEMTEQQDQKLTALQTSIKKKVARWRSTAAH